MHRVRSRRQFFYTALAEGLTAYAERYFYLAESEGSGRSRHQALAARLERYEKKKPTPEVVKAIADVEAELRMPPFPKPLGYLWRSYLRLRRRAPGGFSGPQPVDWPAIEAYARLFDLVPWEIEIIEALDDIYLAPDPPPVLPEGQTVKVAASANDVQGVRSVLSAVGKGRRVVKRTKT